MLQLSVISAKELTYCGMSISDVFSKDQGCCCDLCSPLLALMSEARRLASAVFSPSCGSVANFLPCSEIETEIQNPQAIPRHRESDGEVSVSSTRAHLPSRVLFAGLRLWSHAAPQSPCTGVSQSASVPCASENRTEQGEVSVCFRVEPACDR